MVAFPRLQRYSQFAVLQYNRVAHTLELYRTSMPDGAPPCPVFPDVHMYFIVWDTVLDMINVICKPQMIRQTAIVRRKHLEILEHYRSGRDDFEHYDERMPGSRGKRSRPVVLDASRMEGGGVVMHGEVTGAMEVWSTGHIDASGIYSFADRQWDVGSSSLERLQYIVAEVATTFREEVRTLASIADGDGMPNAAPTS
ncbi:hypothetical protein [Cyanobium sp. Candia 9D4]|uniref:hypothetical protein n=1 Tax=Cyanobium sp. Candia 9D4 TaxID=2823707 RepID=UPI0020CB800C|nr:hypothetical protein [Cyanobium sp. Candia 9D4]